MTPDEILICGVIVTFVLWPWPERREANAIARLWRHKAGNAFGDVR